MNLETIRDFCLELPGVVEDLPFGPDTLVFKVMGKVFLLTPMDSAKPQFNAKCDPEKAEELREKYSDVLPGYHMNKKHWNTVHITGSIPSELLYSWIKDSYELIVDSLPKKDKAALEELK
ncbi:MmcQ/YjbR family DNA-binding protein [Dyadobacter frigoris]|uniref:MmcQ/YjbR family DNA-binding protein n=1 Tax=Dyadobacter frigoris TaxID=2576211 RepID=A0A4U6CVN2_9BACT|nr:MmcQ/YjbR family DNA-binding protein [Dyadobacter frigoris]TKT88732.1 MmcQ/YjbR family DNA-binding protein [Dyadobacter frigoris]GLU53924.1 DNA-binding protein [Dyadobacter frigoris]